MEPIHFFVANLEQLEGDYQRTINEDERGYTHLSMTDVCVLVNGVSESDWGPYYAGSFTRHMEYIHYPLQMTDDSQVIHIISEKSLLAFRDVDLSNPHEIMNQFVQATEPNYEPPFQNEASFDLLATLVRLSTVALDRRKQLFLSQRLI